MTSIWSSPRPQVGRIINFGKLRSWLRTNQQQHFLLNIQYIFGVYSYLSKKGFWHVKHDISIWKIESCSITDSELNWVKIFPSGNSRKLIDLIPHWHYKWLRCSTRLYIWTYPSSLSISETHNALEEAMVQRFSWNQIFETRRRNFLVEILLFLLLVDANKLPLVMIRKSHAATYSSNWARNNQILSTIKI